MRKLLLLITLSFSHFLMAQDWTYNFDDAKKQATEQDKNIIIVSKIFE